MNKDLTRGIIYLFLACFFYFLKVLLENNYSTRKKKYDSPSKSFLERIKYKNYRHAAKSK